jgi:hypothetical protein
MTVDRSTLPSNVRRWLDRSVPVDAQIPNRILNTQAGEMDIRGRWAPFTAETFYQAEPFTFIWKARFSIIPGMWLVAEGGHDLPGAMISLIIETIQITAVYVCRPRRLQPTTRSEGWNHPNKTFRTTALPT